MYRLLFAEWLFREERYFDYVDIDWENDDPDEIVNKVFSVPCRLVPSDTSGHNTQGTWGMEDFKTLACVIKGEKPVAWLKGNKCFYAPKLKNLFNHFLDMAARRGMAVIQQDMRGACPGYIVGKPEVCAKLKPYADAHDRYQHMANMHARADAAPPPAFPANLHREIGKILGYPPGLSRISSLPNMAWITPRTGTTSTFKTYTFRASNFEAIQPVNMKGEDFRGYWLKSAGISADTQVDCSKK